MSCSEVKQTAVVWNDADAPSSSQSSQSSQCSRGVALKLEELVETLQDRRRRADQVVRLQLQQAEKSIMVRESREAGSEVRDEHPVSFYQLDTLSLCPHPD